MATRKFNLTRRTDRKDFFQFMQTVAKGQTKIKAVEAQSIISIYDWLTVSFD